jgi:hypothetical protein
MKFTIKKNAHRAFPPLWGARPWSRHMSRRVVFYPSCKYDIGGEDQFDTNKLFGRGYTSFWRLLWVGISWPMFILLNRNQQHKHSARFGWRYDTGRHTIVLSAYCYINGERYIQEICDAKFEHMYQCSIRVEQGQYLFSVVDLSIMTGLPLNKDERNHWEARFNTGHSKRWSFPLGVYFGGNAKAPHRMIIKMIR